MKPPVTNVIAAGCVLLAAAFTASETLNKKVGDEVVLKPGCNLTITSIVWKVGLDIAVSWEGEDTEYYRQFKARGKLDNSSGALTITGLSREDSGRYTPEINNIMCKTTELIVLLPVPTPTVSVSCDEKTCTLTCDGDTAGAEPVQYEWMFDNLNKDLPKTHVITKENSSTVSEFRCKIKNSVSEMSSEAVTNPTGSALKINTGLTVFISLVTAVVLLVLIHKWKSGLWFFQKSSMPWEADFWKKDSQATDAAESNGITARPEKEQAADEETPMT